MVLKLVYPGQVYKGKQDVGKLFQAVRELIDEDKIPRNGISVSFYGTQKETINSLSVDYSLGGVVNVFDRVSRDEVLRVEREADVLLVFDWIDPLVDPGCGTKLYEYLPLGVAILVVGSKVVSDMRSLVESTFTGVYCSSVEEVKRVLGFWWMERYGYEC